MNHDELSKPELYALSQFVLNNGILKQELQGVESLLEKEYISKEINRWESLRDLSNSLTTGDKVPTHEMSFYRLTYTGKQKIESELEMMKYQDF